MSALDSIFNGFQNFGNQVEKSTSTPKPLEGQTLISKQMYDQLKALPEFANAKVDPFGMGMGKIDKATMGALNNYSIIDKSKLGDDLLSKKLAENLYSVGDKSYVNNKTLDYFNGLTDNINKTHANYYGMNDLIGPYKSASYYDNGWSNQPAYGVEIDGKQGMYVPLEAIARVQGDKDADRLTYLKNFLGNEDMLKSGKLVNLDQSISDQIVNRNKNQNWVGTDYIMDTPGLGYWFDNPGEFTAKYSPNGAAADLSNPNGAVNTGHGIHDESSLMGSWLMRNTEAQDLSSVPGIGGNLEKSKWLAQSETDPSLWARLDSTDGNWHQSAFDQYVTKKSTGFAKTFSKLTGTPTSAYQAAGKVLDTVAPVLSAIPVTSAFAQAYMAARNTVGGVQSGNLGQIGSGLLSMYGVANPGTSAASSLGSSLNDGLNLGMTSKNAIGALGGGAINTGLGLLSGKSPGQALLGGLASGAAGYTGGELSSLFKNQGIPPALASALSGGGGSAVGALISGNKNVGANALAGLFSGGLSGTGKEAGLNPQTANSLAKLITTMALNKQRRG